MTFGVVDRIIILKEGYTVKNLEFAVVCVETVHVRGSWFTVHLGQYDDTRFQQSFTLTSVVERLHGLGTSLEDPEDTGAC